jgi:membrane protein implicated in regulation of membrane protease activity
MSTLRSFFWVLALGVIAAYTFFLVLGAFAPDEVLPVTLVILALVLAWLVHAMLERRHANQRDVFLARARERRGF